MSPDQLPDKSNIFEDSDPPNRVGFKLELGRDRIKEMENEGKSRARISVVPENSSLKIGVCFFNPNLEYFMEEERTNDMKINYSNDSVFVPLLKRFARSFGIVGDVEWEEDNQQIVGKLLKYNSTSTLYDVVNYYVDQRTPHSADKEEEIDGEIVRHCDFQDLMQISRNNYTLDQGYGIGRDKYGFLRHDIPQDLGLEKGDERTLVGFYDKNRIVISLLPKQEDDPFIQHDPGVFSANPNDYSKIIPEAVLDYEKDTVKIKEDNLGNLFYTLPKEIGLTMGLEEGFGSEWIKVEDLYFTRFVPYNSSNTELVDPDNLPLDEEYLE